MLSASLVALFSLAAAVVAVPAGVNPFHGIELRATNDICGNNLTPDGISQMEKAFASLPTGDGPTDAATPDGTFTVPVYFNVIYAGNGISDGNVPDYQIQQQISVLNQLYSNTGLSFQLQGITRTPNADWFNNAAPGSQQEATMKKALRRGDASTLNIYTVGFKNGPTRGYLGYAAFPWDYQNNPENDGILLNPSALPEGSSVGYNTGRILVHEVGHWVGLLHTFEGGCGGPGDYVDDTPAEASPASGCPIGRDTCPSPGLDPIYNHMDYSDDACRNSFTNGQITRFRYAIRQFRGINL